MEKTLYKLHKLDDLKVNKRYSFHLKDNDIVRGTFDGEALRRLNALSDDSNYDPRFRVSNYSINGGPQVSDDIKLLWASDISKVTNYDLGLIPELSDKVGEYLEPIITTHFIKLNDPKSKEKYKDLFNLESHTKELSNWLNQITD